VRAAAKFIVALGVLSVAIALGAAPAQAADREPFDRVVSAAGQANTHAGSLLVDVLVAVPAGRSANALTRAALRDQGAKPVENAYTFTWLVWNVLPVVQSYNPANQRVAAASALQASQNSWTNAQGSRFAFSYGGTTSRCPSLVKGCRGGQRFDGFNDVGWTRLGGNTLGVTYSSSSIDEADMALNTSFGWSLGCTQQPGLIDTQTVLLHENGHVAGLGHTNVAGATMYPSYSTADCTLAADDIAGIAALYP
jgi:hypothetical protein